MQLYELGLTRGIFQVPVIALFTKYEQFKRDIKMKLEDENEDDHPLAETDIGTEVKRVFEQQYLAGLCGPPPFICLESEYFFLPTDLYFDNLCPTGMHENGQQCTDLINLTANSLSSDVVALMLVAVQKDNLGVSINYAIAR